MTCQICDKSYRKTSLRKHHDRAHSHIPYPRDVRLSLPWTMAVCVLPLPPLPHVAPPMPHHVARRPTSEKVESSARPWVMTSTTLILVHATSPSTRVKTGWSMPSATTISSYSSNALSLSPLMAPGASLTSGSSSFAQSVGLPSSRGVPQRAPPSTGSTRVGAMGRTTHPSRSRLPSARSDPSCATPSSVPSGRWSPALLVASSR